MEKRSRRISEEQWNVLLEFLEENPTIARGYNNTSQGRRESARLWQEVASRLNATGSGTSKSPKEWSVYVSNYKGKLKKVVADINADASGTGGGPPRGSMLSDHDARFLSILGPGFGQTAAQVRVDPFPNPVPQPSTSRPLPQPLIEEEFNIILEMEQEPVQDIAASTTLSPVGAAAISPLAQSPASGTAPPLPRRQRRTRIRKSSRMLASASFVGVLIVIGLPLWWKTTEVYRVALPYDKIAAFDSFSHVIHSKLTVLANDDPTAAEIAGLVEKDFEDSDVIKLKISKSVLPEALRQTLDSVADEQEAVEEVAARYDLTDHNQFYLVQRKHLFQDVWLATERVMFFRDAKASRTAVEALKQWVYQLSVLAGARAEAADAARRVRFPPARAYRVLVHTPHAAGLEEDIEDYIGSFLDELSILHNFTLKSQSLHLLNFDFQAKEVRDGSGRTRHFAVRRSRLPLLLTELEARAATSVPQRPAIELALYRAPCSVAPLVIYDADDKPNEAPIQAFLSPQWGGVVLASPSAAECASGTWRPPTRLIMGAFISHLRKLLGIADTERIQGAYLEPLRSVPPRRWELDALLRLRALEQLAAAQRTLQSLAQLLGEIYNIVINDEVGASINSAVESIEDAEVLLRRGALLEAYQEAQRAAEAAETAFMEPSLLALLYFPDDQKYAVYIPLFLPIMFPVVLSLKNLLLWLRGKPLHKEKAD